MSRWKTIHRCRACRNKLTRNERMYSDGCCPKCGALTKGTIVSTFNEVSKVSTAWSITKLKWVRWLLKPLLRFHIWLELRGRGQ